MKVKDNHYQLTMTLNQTRRLTLTAHAHAPSCPLGAWHSECFTLEVNSTSTVVEMFMDVIWPGTTLGIGYYICSRVEGQLFEILNDARGMHKECSMNRRSASKLLACSAVASESLGHYYKLDDQA